MTRHTGRHMTWRRARDVWQAAAYLRAGGNPDVIPQGTRAAAWQAAGRTLYRDIGHGWLVPWRVAPDRHVVDRLAGLPYTVASAPDRIPCGTLNPVRRHDGPTDGSVPLPFGGETCTFVDDGGRVHRGLYWAGSYAQAAQETGSDIAKRAARAQERCGTAP